MKQPEADRIVAKSLNTAEAEQRIQAAQSPAMQLARLHLAYGKARSEGRSEDARAIKAQYMQLRAQELSVGLDVYVREHAEYVTERKAA